MDKGFERRGLMLELSSESKSESLLFHSSRSSAAKAAIICASWRLSAMIRNVGKMFLQTCERRVSGEGDQRYRMLLTAIGERLGIERHLPPKFRRLKIITSLTDGGTLKPALEHPFFDT